jgi:hypothetical protein
MLVRAAFTSVPAAVVAGMVDKSYKRIQEQEAARFGGLAVSA